MLSLSSPSLGPGRRAVGQRQIKRVGRASDCDGADDRGAGRRGHRHVAMVTAVGIPRLGKYFMTVVVIKNTARRVFL